MDIPKIIKLIIAGLIAIVLAGTILYVKLKHDEPEAIKTAETDNNVPIASDLGKSAEEKLYESISIPSEQKQIEQPKIAPEVQASVSAPAAEKSQPQPKVSQDVLNSLSAPAKK